MLDSINLVRCGDCGRTMHVCPTTGAFECLVLGCGPNTIEAKALDRDAAEQMLQQMMHGVMPGMVIDDLARWFEGTSAVERQRLAIDLLEQIRIARTEPDSQAFDQTRVTYVWRSS
jgi:hypothetical protein